ncbi:MAG: 30S ribosomal protein S13 [Candidatus Omnitrophica bacterium]|nr:30S ribosomal protein S13 [Candidatus Omnitrophota bacterium]
MPRILGTDIPREKRIDAALPYIYGIGKNNALDILKEANIEPHRRSKDLSDEEIARITAIVQSKYLTEGDLRREVNQNIKRLIEIQCFRGLRHRKGLPTRGQRTKTNSRTRKGRKPSIGAKSKKRS